MIHGLVQVRAGYFDEMRQILVIGSDGTFATDVQPMARFSVSCIAKSAESSSKARRAVADASVWISFLQTRHQNILPRTRRGRPIIQLDAVEAPAGEMEVVLGPGWPGILLHEAIGHGLEADFNRKGLRPSPACWASAWLQTSAPSWITATLPSRRGSINVDDEGFATQNTGLIEKGILKGYLSDSFPRA